MDEMTKEQLERYISERVKNILSAREEFFKSLGDMAPSERDQFVRRRIERDLAVEQAIFQRVLIYVDYRRWTWRAIVALDVIALLGLVGIALNDWRDVVAFAGVGIVMLLSRSMNRLLEVKAQDIQDLLSKHLRRSVDTASLYYLVEGVQEQDEAGLDDGIDRTGATRE